jgi:hypothetical protein
MIRWFFYAAIAIVVSILSERIYSKNNKRIDEMSLVSIVLFLFVGIVCVLSFYSSIIFFFIGVFKVLSNFNCW